MKENEDLELEGFFKAGRPVAPPPKADEFEYILKHLEPRLFKAGSSRPTTAIFAAAAAFCAVTIISLSWFTKTSQPMQINSISVPTTNSFIEEDAEENLDQPSMSIGEEFLTLSDRS